MAELAASDRRNGSATSDAISTLTAVGHTITALYSGDPTYAPGSQTLTQTVNPATPTINWNNPTDIVYGTPLSATQLDATASVPGGFAYNPGFGAVLNAGDNQTLSTTFTPTDTTDYTDATAIVAINVLQATPTVNVTAPNAAYNGSPYSVLTSSVTGINNANLGAATSFTYYVGVGTGGTDLGGTDPTAAGTYTVVAHYAGSANYAAADSVPTSFTITPQAITVTANPQTKVYGTADPALTYQITSGSLVSGDSFSGSLTRVPGENVGSYAIEQGTLTAGSNYDLTFVGANLLITPAPLTVTANNQTMVYGGAVPALTYTYTGLVNGDSSASFTGSLATAATSSSSAGSSYAITEGTLAATGNYKIGTFTSGMLTVEPDTTTKLASSADPSLQGQSVTFTATVSNASSSVTPLGSVQFTIDGNSFGSPVPSPATRPA